MPNDQTPILTTHEAILSDVHDEALDALGLCAALEQLIQLCEIRAQEPNIADAVYVLVGALLKKTRKVASAADPTPGMILKGDGNRTPVSRAFPAWVAARNRIDFEGVGSGDAPLPSLEEAYRLADKVSAPPCESPLDFIYKFMARTFCGDADPFESNGEDGLYAEARGLISACRPELAPSLKPNTTFVDHQAAST